MADLMERLKHALGFGAEPPSMNSEQAAVAKKQRNLERRQHAIDIQVDVLRSDRAEARRHE